MTNNTIPIFYCYVVVRRLTYIYRHWLALLLSIKNWKWYKCHLGNLMLVLFFYGWPVYADNICERQNLGWHFYCDPKKEEDPESLKAVELTKAEQELADIKQKLNDLKVIAVMNPTAENLKNYISFQKEQLDRAAQFSRKWQEVVWQNPEVDYLVKHPISSVGNDLNGEIKNQKIADTLMHLNERYGLFFFYSSGCSFCLKFSPILKAFAQHYKLEVMAISMDGGILPDWPGSRINHGEAERFGMVGKPVPALILFDSKYKKIIPVGFGLLTMDELEERITRLATGNIRSAND